MKSSELSSCISTFTLTLWYTRSVLWNTDLKNQHLNISLSFTTTFKFQLSPELSIHHSQKMTPIYCLKVQQIQVFQNDINQNCLHKGSKRWFSLDDSGDYSGKYLLFFLRNRDQSFWYPIFTPCVFILEFLVQNDHLWIKHHITKPWISTPSKKEDF